MNYLVEFSPYSALPFFSPLGQLESGDLVITKDKIGEDIGRVVGPTEEEEVGVILRLLTEADRERLVELKKLEGKAFSLFQEMGKRKKLPIKILHCHIRWDKKLLTFYIIAHYSFDWEKTAHLLEKEIPIKVRIKEADPRVYASLLKGIGKCGRELCCVAFKGKIPRVSLRSARLQNLFLSTERISGICGRLLCCLAYEAEFYQEALTRYPALGSIVKTKFGFGPVANIDIFHELISVRIKNREVTVHLSELEGEEQDESLHLKKPPEKD